MRPKLLLIGDSIRRSYQPLVADRLAGKCELVGVDLAVSCGDTRATLALFDDEIAHSGANVIHWNNGLHDIRKDRPKGQQCAVPPDEYEHNLEELWARLQQIAPGEIIWARTTPVIEARHNHRKSFFRFNRDIDAYNDIADAVMSKHHVPINDLHAIIAAQPTACIREDGVHLTNKGKAALAEAVVTAVLALLAEKR